MRAGKTSIRIVQGDVTNQDVDAVVNAANSSLLGGGGVDGAIHRAGGPRILEECREIRRTRCQGGLPTGEAVITTGGNMRARHVIHTVGPVWAGGGHNEEKELAKAYRNSLRVAEEKSLRSIAFPSISTGAYGYPKDEATAIAVKAVRDYLQRGSNMEEVVFVLYSPQDYSLYMELAPRILVE
jgi:O-acetyl-ADP-ribose deacetylase (regulator of RNase III)